MEVRKKTRGEGVNIIINYASGIQSYSDTVNYTSDFAYYVETVRHNLNENKEIGDLLNFRTVDKNVHYYKANL